MTQHLVQAQHMVPEDRIELMGTSAVTEIFNAYRRLEASVPVVDRLHKVTYRSPLNFHDAAKYPRHRWFAYKEGFSPGFVHDFLSRFLRQGRGHVLDPFAGVGTSVIQAALEGQAGIGIDVNPLAVFVGRTKATPGTSGLLSRLDAAVNQFEKDELSPVAANSTHKTVTSYFDPVFLDALLRVKAFYQNIADPAVRDLFKLAFLRMIEPFSTHRKAGNGLKRKTNPPSSGMLLEPILWAKTTVLGILEMFREDLVTSPQFRSPEFISGSAFEPQSYPDEDYGCVLTSPPYPNCFDYSKIYLNELWLGDFFTDAESQHDFRMQSARSHVHAVWPTRFETLGSHLVDRLIYPFLKDQRLWSRHIPDMVRGYFQDLGRYLEVLGAKLRRGCPVGIVVANSAYGGLPIATDLIICEIAAARGWQVESLEVYRRVIPSSQQYVRLDSKQLLRESLVVLRKQ